jgi:hypothetical protein
LRHQQDAIVAQQGDGAGLAPYAVIVQLIGNTRTTAGLKICAELDNHVYPLKETVTAEQLAQVRLTPATFHGEWNYTVTPHG